MQVSVIIPTLNEEENMKPLLALLHKGLSDFTYELIVVDAKSTDNTQQISIQNDAHVVISSEKSRALQMNLGAKQAKGEILYFVHADSRPPIDFLRHILKALQDGFGLGCFRFRFDSNNILLKMNGFFTRFDREMCRGGDQTLFIKRIDFNVLGGFRADYRIMEEYEFIARARKSLKFKIIPKEVVVSARKYEENSYFRVNLANLTVFTLYRRGASQETLIKTYRKLLRHPKAEALV